MSEIKIFLASSSELKADRDQFQIFISNKNDEWRDRDIFLRVIRWENFLDAMSKEGLQSEYNKAVEDCDIFVMLVQNKVGQFTAEEFGHAFGKFTENKRPLIYTYFKPWNTRDQDELKSLWEFEAKLKELKHYKTPYENIEGLREHFGNQLTKLDEQGFFAVDQSRSPQPPRTQPPQKSLVEQYRVPLQMPPLPDHFVERPDTQDAVKEQLLCENDKGGTLVVSAIHGLGGIGKSVLAAKLAHEQDVQRFFADGILWETLGQNPDILPKLNGWIKELGDHDYKPTAVSSASSHLRTLLYDKCILLVVDDVWNPAHLEPFRVGGAKSRVLVTTREARIAGAQIHALNVMNKTQALDLITQKITEPLSKTSRKRALTFADRVGYLPLALELAASQINDGVSWKELLEDFAEEIDRLETLDVYGRSEMPDDEKRRQYSLRACFNLSLRQLSNEELQQFAWLGVVPEDVSLTRDMAETLWQVNRRQAGSILRKFQAKSLVLQGVQQADERASYRMHDLMHDLAQTLLTLSVVPEKNGELPGLGLTVAQAHGELLAKYAEKVEKGADGQPLWHTLKNDGYIFAHLTWHMEQAQQPDAIHALLAASNVQGRNGWYEACNALGQPAGFVNDVGRAWALAKENYEAAPGETVALLYRYALVRGSLNSLASNIPAEMVGGLVKEGYWQPAQGLAYAQQAQNPWQRAACISAIAPYMPEALLPEVLKTVGQIKDAAYRSYVLSKLAECFPTVWPDVLTAIQQIEDRYGEHRNQTSGFSYRAFALTKVIKKLPPRYLPRAIDISHQIQDPADCATAMIAIAQHLPELWPKALEMTRQIKDEYWRSSALSEIAQHLPELWPDAVEMTRQIKDESYRAIALSEIAQHLPQEHWPEALEMTRQIKDESSRASALSEIAQHLLELWPDALEITRQIKNESDRARALSAIAQHLPELWPKALEMIRQIKDESDRAIALRDLAQHLPQKHWPKALKMTRQIKDESDRSWALSALAQHLPTQYLPQTLEIAWSIQEKYYCAQAFTAFLPALENNNITFSEWAQVLDVLAYQKRSNLIELLPNSQATLTRLGDPHTLPTALQSIRDICNQWP
ncbi:MAG: NB-ARC domain-containing protein [Phormidesmis sp.]